MHSPRWENCAGSHPLPQLPGRVRVKPIHFLIVATSHNTRRILFGAEKPFRYLRIASTSMFGRQIPKGNSQLWCGFMVDLIPVGRGILRFSMGPSWLDKVSC